MIKIVMICLGILLIVSGIVIGFADIYSKTIEGAAKDIAVNIVASKINKSLVDGFDKKGLEEPLLYIEKDSDGIITYIEPNTIFINKLILDFSTGVKENYSLDDINSVKMNLGVLTGNKLLSQIPFFVDIKVMPLSLTKFQCETEFETEGINQTRYYVYCRVESTVRVLAPFTDETVQINRKYLIAEAIVVGRVPENYVMVPKESILDAIE